MLRNSAKMAAANHHCLAGPVHLPAHGKAMNTLLSFS
jgi:hypothetical protein